MQQMEGSDSSARTVPRFQVGWPERFDVLVVIGIIVFYVIAFVAEGGARHEQFDLMPRVLATLVPLLWRSQAPVLVFMLVIALQWTVLEPSGGAYQMPGGMVGAVATLVALGGVAARRPLWTSLTAWAASLASMALSLINTWGDDSAGWAVLSSTVICSIVWCLGTVAQRTRRHMQELEADERRASQAVMSERVRIASDLNGIIRRALRVMADETGSARDHLGRDRERVTRALASVESVGVEAMHELRRLLHVLHDDPSLAIDESAPPAEPEEASFRAWIARLPLRLDRSDLAVTIGVVVATMWFTSDAFGDGAIPVLASLYFGVVLLVVLWRRLFPLAVFVLVIAGHAVAVLLFRGGDFISYNQAAIPAVLVALAAVAAAKPVWISIPVLVIAWGYISLSSLQYPATYVMSFVVDAAAVAAVWLAGLVVGRRRRRIHDLQAARESAERAVASERARLAYELHDVVGHAITIMVLQAAGARRILLQDPARAAAALVAIEEAGREAEEELERLLALLDPRDPAQREGTTEPLLGLSDVGQLVERTRRTVVNTELEILGEPGSLEPSVDAAAYSVAREALANAVKHAGPHARVGLTITWMPDLVRIEVTSGPGPRDGTRATELSGGYGLLSIRERVGLAGGDLRWYSEGNRFHLDARLPTGSRRLRAETDHESPHAE
ncbi:histidine kinase [Microbacterium sp. B2969]|uniref:histidine kinase n=1 Tax=Microbacterium alkaliflavum TaxID=3248839 RepID=A0ABW7Q6X3_9MICO